MEKGVSLGLMEQPLMREEVLSEEKEKEFKNLISRIGHLEVKYLATIERVKERTENFSSGKSFLLHAQYPTEGAGILNLVDPELKGKLGEKFLKIIERLDPEWFSLHLGLACEKLQSGGQFGFEAGLSEPLEEAEIKKRMKENLDHIKKTFLKRGEVLLENLDYMPKKISGGSYEYVCEPAFIRNILNETGCRMLLDFGHVVVSAKNLGYKNVEDYVKELPLEKVVEIHMSGAGKEGELAQDSHHPITAEGQREVEYLEGALKSGRMTSLAAVTLETFEDIVPQLELLKNVLERSGYKIAAL
jgi:uncharacterized protein (UPF0276 family)